MSAVDIERAGSSYNCASTRLAIHEFQNLKISCERGENNSLQQLIGCN